MKAENNSRDEFLKRKINEIKEHGLAQISPSIIIKPAIFSFIVLIGTLFLDLSKVPFFGDVTIGIAKQLYPNWVPATSTIEPLQFWWLPLISYLFFIGIAFKEYRGLFNHIRATTPRQNVDRIISSSISLIDGYATALPLVGAAILLVSIKLGPEIFLGISVPFEIKALIVLALAKLFEPVLDYIGVKFQKVTNRVEDYKEQFYQKNQLQQTEKLIRIFEENGSQVSKEIELPVEHLVKYREELEKIKTISFETYQNFHALNKLTSQINQNLKGNEEHLNILNQLSENVDSMATNLCNEGVSSSLNSLELIVNKR
ncbi:MAG: hypothetical protein GY936_11810 [Ignavibacteriae bacterium]|nr:hypothetical protein [Ignavibacteriota bacterium]